MKNITIKVPAKINLTLDVLGLNEGYHDINSLVCSVDLFETIKIKPRKDGLISLKCKGIDPCCDLYSNNAYKAIKLFREKYGTKGVDVTIDKKIPVGAGLGGSSADVSGVLNGMKAVFELDVDLEEIALNIGSDTAYMLKGGWARISGRGERVEFLDVDKKLYMIILTADENVSSKHCYRKFDILKKKYQPCTDGVIEALKHGKQEELFALAKNDLTNPAITFVKDIDFNIKALKKAGAPLAVMTGSGSATVGVFFNKAQRDKVYKVLKPLYNDKAIKVETI